VETIAGAFTDHLAVLLRVAMTTPFIQTGRGIWRTNVTNLNDLPFQEEIKEVWTEWKTHMSRYPDIVNWWDQYVKSIIKLLFIREGTERNDWIKMENFYYTAIYDVLQEPDQHRSKTLAMRRLKAKIIV